MKIEIKERNQDKLIKSLKIHFDNKSKQYVGDMIDFIDEILKQSGYSVICYHYEGLGCPISIIENKKLEKGYDEPVKVTKLEIEDVIDEQLVMTNEDGSQTNIWHGKYSHDSNLVRFIKERYKYYFKLGLAELEQS
ncbi:MAG: hypothetical protein ACTSRG_16105 [Candidatus Helarchaeota archaeon]